LESTTARYKIAIFSKRKTSTLNITSKKSITRILKLSDMFHAIILE